MRDSERIIFHHSAAATKIWGENVRLLTPALSSFGEEREKIILWDVNPG